MISLIVDEAYAFDYLSILSLKIVDERSEASYVECLNHLRNQFTPQMWATLFHSKEYQRIKDANLQTFMVVDKAKRGEVSAKEVDYCNYQRYLAKQVFQKTFFSVPLSETKIGYDVYDKSVEKINS